MALPFSHSIQSYIKKFWLVLGFDAILVTLNCGGAKLKFLFGVSIMLTIHTNL